MRTKNEKPGSDKTRKGGVSDRSLIRELYEESHPYYTLPEALRLTRTTETELSAAIEQGEVEPEVLRGATLLAWEDVMALALTRWTPRMIHTALFDWWQIPDLNRMVHSDVLLPKYQLRLMHHLAETLQGTFRLRLNMSDIVESLLHAYANTLDLDPLEEAIPGIRDALRYPYFVLRENDHSSAICRYCGRVSDAGTRAVCTTCAARHEPVYRGHDEIEALDDIE